MYGIAPHAHVGLNPYLRAGGLRARVGAPILAAGGGRAVPSFALASGATPAIVPDISTTGVEVPFGMPSISLATTVSGTVSDNSQGWFRPRRYCLPDSLAEFAIVTSITIGVRSCLANAGNPVIGSMFGTKSVDQGVTFFTAGPGIKLAVGLTNIDTVTHVFYSSFLGAFVDGASGGQAITG